VHAPGWKSRLERKKATMLKERLMTSAHVIGHGRRRAATLGLALKSRIRRAWRAYWEWQRRRTTVRILSALDERTLRDIGMDPSEITSYAYGDPDQRRRRCEASWRGSLHA
jgi:uncharacterized protein YjiS (DUF1127 family)